MHDGCMEWSRYALHCVYMSTGFHYTVRHIRRGRNSDMYVDGFSLLMYSFWLFLIEVSKKLAFTKINIPALPMDKCNPGLMRMECLAGASCRAPSSVTAFHLFLQSQMWHIHRGFPLIDIFLISFHFKDFLISMSNYRKKYEENFRIFHIRQISLIFM